MIKQTLLACIFALSTLIAAPALAEANKTLEQAETVILYVNINTDSAEKLADLLTGIGTTKAQAIVDYRTKNGPFNVIEDLLNVPGIGPATLEKNKHAIRLSAAS